jgi:uncharacterized membrane protein YgdD (TMEM256/DUF423 family)
MRHKLFALAALSMAVGVACGAFGAHALRGTIPDTDLDIWEKSVFYNLIHGLAVLAILVAPLALVEERLASRVAKVFLFGQLVFCGSLYALVLTNLRWLGAITPIGGVCFIVGWLMLGWATLRRAG